VRRKAPLELLLIERTEEEERVVNERERVVNADEKDMMLLFDTMLAKNRIVRECIFIEKRLEREREIDAR